jgi:hypothetical protein
MVCFCNDEYRLSSSRDGEIQNTGTNHYGNVKGARNKKNRSNNRIVHITNVYCRMLQGMSL